MPKSKRKTKMKKILILISLLVVGCSKPVEEEEIPQWSAVELLRKQHKEELSEWDKLIMAISFTESRWNPDAVGSAHDSGHLQLVPIYVAEVNRLYDTEYTIEDAFDISKSLEMYELMQQAYNPSRDINRAIYYHNKSESYKQTVLRNLELVRNYEAIRAKLIEK